MTEPEPREQLIADLVKPFAVVKSRVGAGGKRFSYVDGTQVIQRLNAATGNDWSMSVDNVQAHPMGDNTLWVATVSLTIPGLGTRSHIGVQMASNRAGEDMVKGCVTDAMKKAATLFGVGIELYGEDYPDAEQTTHNPPSQAKTAAPAAQRQAAAPAKQPPDPDAIISAEGVTYLRRVSSARSITPAMLDRLTLEMYDKTHELITNAQARHIAEHVQNKPLSMYQYILSLPAHPAQTIPHTNNVPKPPTRGPGEPESYPQEEAKADAPKGNAAQAAAQYQQRQERFADVPNGAQPATQRQTRYMWAIANEYAKANNLDGDEFVHGQIAEMLGLTSVTEMNRNQMTKLIDNIQSGNIVDYVPAARVDPVQRQELFGNGAH